MGARKLPYAFTEQGIAMLSSVLKSRTAVEVNIRIMRAFVAMRRFVADLIRKAKHSITLIDNYVDDTVLTLLDKRETGVSATIYTQHISSQFRLDVERHNSQYPTIEIKQFNKAHDRFLLIDDEVYHIGASIKDLGKKWFGFTLMRDITVAELIGRIAE